MNPPEPSDDLMKRSLGRIEINQELIEHDVALSDRYQAFSGEIVRLGLLGIAGTGFLIADVILKRGDPSPTAQITIVLSLLSFGVSIAAGLLHRYASTDSLSCHLRLLRLEIRNRPASADSKGESDESKASDERSARDKWFKASSTLLLTACIALWCGAVFLAVVLASVIL